jgi:hypothetical protein
MSRRKVKLLLMTVALLLAPLAGVVLLAYSVGQVAVRRRRVAQADNYREWLALRDLAQARSTTLETAPRSPA